LNINATLLQGKFCSDYSYAGIFCLSSKSQGLHNLGLQRAYFLNDQHVVQLSSFLGDLMSINLSGCENITKSSLFVFARSCPLLCEIKMEGIGSEIVENSDSSMDFGVYPQYSVA
jgi:hypothetical protein